MDITTLFKACVKTVRTINKKLDEKEQKLNIPKLPQKDSNLTKAKNIAKQITELQHFLNENKAAYLNVINYLSTNKTLSTSDREKIDLAAEKIINSCTTLINEYKREIRNVQKSKQREEHYRNIIESLEKYLKDTSKIYTETRAIRVKRVIETHKLSKLGSIDSPKGTQLPIIESNTQLIENTNNQLTAEEMQMFESENDLLYSELNSLSDEVRQIESKVVHIAELQELFTEKVLQQEQDIDRISTTVVGASSNLTDANEQIRQAIQRNAGLRVWVLFFLLVMSFSLLFLDWYND